MIKLAIVLGLLACAPLVAVAQEAAAPSSGARLITPIAPATPPPFVRSGEPGRKTENAPESRAQQTPADNRGTEQSPLSVRIIPAPRTPAEAARDAADQQERATANLWMMLLGGAVAVGAVLQFGAWIALIVTTRRQVRAYVFVAGAEIIDVEIGAVPIVQVEIKNAGQTPAHELRHVWRCGFFEHPLNQKLPLPLPSEPSARTHLAPGASVKTHRIAEKQLTGAANTELTNRATALYVYGEILYKDAFNRQRFTRYVFFHAGLPRMGPGQLVAHEKGNEAS